MSERNLEVIRNSFQALNAHDAHAFAATLDSTYVLETDTLPSPVHGPQAAGEVLEPYWKAFPDLQYDVESMIATEETVMTRWKASATHNAEFMGIPATHRSVSVRGCTINELKDGKVTHAWVYWDLSTVLRQLGVLGETGKSATATP
jgi:steroid delta-isomerase-like uncharacterized protein